MNTAPDPIMEWESQEPFEGNVVWWTRLDGRFQVEVVRVGESVSEYQAELRVFDHNNNNRLLLNERVGLAYGARFGPDVDDVREWQARVLRFVDEELK